MTSTKKPSKKSHARADGNTQISISLSETLVAKIDEAAKAENRNRSNYIATTLERVIANGRTSDV